MLFNSFDFGLFLVIVYLLYWGIGVTKRKAQNILLLIASYVFYGLWDWRFLSLIAASSLIDYYAAKGIESTQKDFSKKLLLWGSIIWNLGVLIVFKYYNFFLENFSTLFGLESPTEGFYIWNVIIPVGLSFYTFQTMSYTIDVYRERIKATDSILDFFCFVSFFPQLVAGPIERAENLLPQFKKIRQFDLDDSKEGLRRILWGLFKKMVVADNVAIAINVIYASPEDYGSLSLLYASILFFFQIYCDFSGYCDIAIGSAKLFGFKLSENFKTPYMAKSITDFWTRWHITLTQWFTDYVYRPATYVKKSKKITATSGFWALLLTMTLIGLWHGASWTFILFGLFNGLVIVLERIRFGNGKRSLLKLLQKAPRVFTSLYIIIVLIISAMLFRAQTFETFWTISTRILSLIPDNDFSFIIGKKIIVLPILLIIEIYTRHKPFPFFTFEKKFGKPIRWIIYYSIIFLLIRYAGPKEQFIYFQF